MMETSITNHNKSTTLDSATMVSK